MTPPPGPGRGTAGRDVPLDDQYEPLAEPAQAIEFAARSGQIHQCLEQLDPTRRTCILHAYVDGYSHSEIAQKLSTPLGTVKAWIKTQPHRLARSAWHERQPG